VAAVVVVVGLRAEILGTACLVLGPLSFHLWVGTTRTLLTTDLA